MASHSFSHCTLLLVEAGGFAQGVPTGFRSCAHGSRRISSRSSPSSSICSRSRTSLPIARTSGATRSICERMLQKRGFGAELLETAGNPLVYGELKVPGARRTLLLYFHYDGQPVDREALAAAGSVQAGDPRRQDLRPVRFRRQVADRGDALGHRRAESSVDFSRRRTSASSWTAKKKQVRRVWSRRSRRYRDKFAGRSDGHPRRPASIRADGRRSPTAPAASRPST